MTRLQAEILNLILRMAKEFPQRKEQLIFIINNYDLMLSVLTVKYDVIDGLVIASCMFLGVYK